VDENQLKQRIVGAIVLVALAVIFIPMLFSGDKDKGMSIFGTNIPPKPDNVAKVKTLEIPSPQQPPAAEKVIRTPVDEQNVESVKADSKKPVSEEEKPAVVSKREPGVTTKSKDAKAWAVQVGSFSNPDNALGLRNKLRDKGYSAFVEKVTTSKGEVYRVRVGPEVKRSEAEALQQELQAKLKLKGLVVAHP
jgi:DedD protein